MVEYNWKKEREKYRTDFRKTEPEPVMQSAPPAAPGTDWRKVAFAVIAAAVAVVAIIGIIFAVSSGKKPESAPVAEKAPAPAAPVAAKAPAPAVPVAAKAPAAPVPAPAKPQTPAPASASAGQDSAVMLAAVAEKHKSAVGLVVVVMTYPTGKKIVSPIGTAWAFANNKFATNAHVAMGLKGRVKSFITILQKLVVRENLSKAKCKSIQEFTKKFGQAKTDALIQNAEDYSKKSTAEVCIVINGSYGQIKSVSHVQVHPGWEVVNSKFEPDVAVLTIRGTHDCYFKLAGPEQFRNLKSGEPVAYLGFPMESLAKHNINVDNPIASMQSGIIVAVSDFEMKNSGVEGNYMIRHNLPSAGGASGSPIFNCHGEVIALHNASNAISQEVRGESIRTPSAAMINFGVRVDLLKGMGEPVEIQTFLKQ